LVVSDIYAAGEEPIEGVNAEVLVEAIRRAGHKNVRYTGNLNDISDVVEKELQAGDLVITMGAGNIWRVGEELVKRFS
jgi:UDP-N-acetylmuramate--alanine ligase